MQRKEYYFFERDKGVTISCCCGIMQLMDCDLRPRRLQLRDIIARLLQTAFFVWTLALSINSSALFLADTILPSVPFKEISLLSFPAALVLTFFLMRAVPLPEAPSSFLLLCAAGAVTFLLWPVGFDIWSPASIDWDGANVIGITAALLHYESHKTVMEAQYSLHWGGSLWTYPWGFSGVTAGVAQLFQLESSQAAALVHFICNFLIITAVGTITIRMGSGPVFAAASAFIAAMLISVLIYRNYWTQSAGILILLACMSTAPFSSVSIAARLATGLLIIGMGYIYPLYVPPLISALLIYWIVLLKRPVIPALMNAAFLTALSSAFVLLSWRAQMNRLTYHGGPDILDDATVAVFLAALIPVAVYTLLMRKLADGQVCFAALLLLIVLINGVSLYIYSVHGYWGDKLLLSSAIIGLPIAASLCSAGKGRKTLLRTGYFAAATFAFFVLYKFAPTYKLHNAAFNGESREILQCLLNNRTERGPYILGGRYDRAWHEALLFPRTPPAPEDYESIVTNWQGDFVKTIASWIEDQMLSGDIVAVIPPTLRSYLPQLSNAGAFEVLCSNSKGLVVRTYK
ncbi:MAG: hypothetical protein J5J00_02965 [Deltaproteobacteria bacterium]|nr:hypothetical protein [Deltaproteobacteria bacterium]